MSKQRGSLDAFLGRTADQEGATPNAELGTGRPSDRLVGLNLKVRPELRREIKAYAATHDMTMVELIAQAFRLYVESQKER